MSKAILLADDSVTIQKVIELTFMDQDYQIEAVSSGDEALRRLDESTPDLVIADVHMPGASGYEVARRSKELRPDTPVLVLVGTFEPFEEDEFSACGADEVLKKPFDSQELLRLVGKLLPVEAEAPVEAEVAEAAPVDDEDTGVFALDDGAFESSSEVMPPADMPPVDAPPTEASAVEKLAWSASTAAAPEAAQESPSVEIEDAQPLAMVTETESVPEPEAAEEVAEAEAAPEAEPETVAEDTSAEDTGAEDTSAEDTSAEDTGDGPLPSGILSDDDIERIAVRVAHLVGEKLVRNIAWDVIPDLAEVVIKERIQELEAEVE